MAENYAHVSDWDSYRELFISDDDFAFRYQLSDYELHEMFDDSMDELWGDVNIFGVLYGYSRVAKEVDPVAYECEFNSWLDSQIGSTLVEF